MARTAFSSTCLLFLLLQTTCLDQLAAAAPPVAAPSKAESHFPLGAAEIELRGNGLVILDGDLNADLGDGTDFGAILACNGSTTRSFVLNNVGSDTLFLSGIAFTGAGIVSASALPASIAAGQGHTFTLTFDPSAVGVLGGTVIISSNDADEPEYDFAIACTGLADVTPPSAQCQPVTLYLGSSGTATLSPAQMDFNSTDDCGVLNLAVSQTTFNCQQNLPVAVTLSVTDASGNVGTCTASVTVSDLIPPVAICPATLNAYLDFQGIAELDINQFNLGSYDNCGIPLHTRWISPTRFFCGSRGLTLPVTLTVADSRQNFSNCVTAVTIIDANFPVIYNCPTGTVTIGPTGSGTAPYFNSFTVYDNCGAYMTFSPATFTCADVGTRPALFTATDGAGNTTTCSTTVAVTELIAPIAVCQNTVLNLGAGATATLPASSIDGGSYDICTSVTISASPNTFSCGQVGNQTVTLTVTDLSGNSSTCSSLVTVVDTAVPTVTCQNTQVQLGLQGTATAPTSSMVQSAWDNCGISSLGASQSLFTCADTSGTPVTVTVADASGNAATCTSVVTALRAPLTLQVLAPLLTCGYHVSCDGANDGTATAVGQGACGPFTYQWSTGATTAQVTGLAAGTYTVTVSDGMGAPAIQSITLTAPPPLQAQVLPPSPVCVGDSIGFLIASTTGGQTCQAYSYLWSTGGSTHFLSGLPAGSYTVTVTDAGGCQSIQQVQLPGLALPVPVANLIGNTLQLQGSYSSVQWYQGGQSIPGAIFPNLVLTASGSYHVVVTDANGCEGASAPITYTPVGVEPGLQQWSDVALYPNPSTGRFSFQMAGTVEGAATVELAELSGRVLCTWRVAALRSGASFDTGAVAAGTYLVVLMGEDGGRRVFRLVRQ